MCLHLRHCSPVYVCPHPDCTNTTKTKDPTELEVYISGSQLQGFGRLSIESDLMLSSGRGLAWATGCLRDYGPLPSEQYCQYWNPQLALVPRGIYEQLRSTAAAKNMKDTNELEGRVAIRAANSIDGEAQHLDPALAEDVLFFLPSGGTVFEPATDPITETIPHIGSNG